MPLQPFRQVVYYLIRSHGIMVLLTILLPGLKAGTYTVTVADSAGITVSGNVVIAEPTPISITIDSVSILCRGGNNGSLQAIVSGEYTGLFLCLDGWNNCQS